MLAYTLTEQGLSLILNGRPTMITPRHPDWNKIINALGSQDELMAILNPTAKFAVGQVWLTRSGSTAVVLEVNRKTRVVTVEVDDCYEMDLILGKVSPDHDLPEDLITCITTRSTSVG